MNRLYSFFLVFSLLLICSMGHFFPLLGYAAPIVAAGPIGVSVIRRRAACPAVCPRKRFLETVVKPVSLHRPPPKTLVSRKFAYILLFLFTAVLTAKLAAAWGNIEETGRVFVQMCTVSTIAAGIIGFLFSHGLWCGICPVGILQDLVYELARKFLEAARRLCPVCVPG